MEVDSAHEDSLVENCCCCCNKNNNNPHEPLISHERVVPHTSTGHSCPVLGAVCMRNLHTRIMQSNQAKQHVIQKGKL